MTVLNNAQMNYMTDLEELYIKCNIRNSKNHYESDLVRIITAIEAIERSNRIMLWRFLEYIFLVLNYFVHVVTKCPIKNITIGVYQIKIECILEQIGINHLVSQKEIITAKRLSLEEFNKVINHSSKYQTVEKMLLNKFIRHQWKSLSDQEIYHIALYYSGNIEFKDEFNYYYVLKNLYYKNQKR